MLEIGGHDAEGSIRRAGPMAGLGGLVFVAVAGAQELAWGWWVWLVAGGLVWGLIGVFGGGLIGGAGRVGFWSWPLRANTAHRAGAVWRGGARWRFEVALCVLVLTGASVSLRASLQSQREAWISDALSSVKAEPARALVTVRGVIERPPAWHPDAYGAMARFGHGRASSTTVLRVQAVQGAQQIGRDDGWQAGGGRLQVVADGILPGFSVGTRVEVTGWLTGFSPPANPGAFDRRAWGQRQGVAGRLQLGDDGRTLKRIEGPGVFHAWRQRWRSAALGALGAGMNDPQVDALLKRLLLGHRALDPEADPSRSFAQVGLAHIMSLSGAHLTVVLIVFGGLVRVLPLHPRWAGGVLILALAGFVLLVPWRVPILRAVLMAAAVVGVTGFGRRLSMLDRVGLAAALVLWASPRQWADPGFQLSFGVVAALAFFVTPMTNKLEQRGARLAQRDTEPVSRPRWPGLLRWFFRWAFRGPSRGLWGPVVVSWVAFAVSWPLVCFHFQQAHPWTVLSALLAIIPVTVLIGVALVKTVIGLVVPSLAGLLAWPAAWLGHGTLRGVAWLERLPAVRLDLPDPPSVVWVGGMLVVTVLLLASMGVTVVPRRLRLVAWGAFFGGLIWLVLGGGRLDGPRYPRPEAGALSLTALSVGDGSAWVMRTQHKTYVFDCGSQADMDVGRKMAVALKALRSPRVDGLFISHADLDHYAGVLDLIDEHPVTAVYVTPQMFSRADPGSALAALRDGLSVRRVEVQQIQQGWGLATDGVGFSALWPPASWSAEDDNDNALVLRCSAGGHRALLFGDNQSLALNAMLAAGIDLQAQVAEAPHHGARNGLTKQWLQAVKPVHVVQSSGGGRLEPGRDPWPGLTGSGDMRWQPMRWQPTRWATARDGAVTIEIDASGIRRVHSMRAGLIEHDLLHGDPALQEDERVE